MFHGIRMTTMAEQSAVSRSITALAGTTTPPMMAVRVVRNCSRIREIFAILDPVARRESLVRWRHLLVITVASAVAWSSAPAQVSDTLAAEHFAGVRYLGGHGVLATEQVGVLVFGDSALLFYECRAHGCAPLRGRTIWIGEPRLTLPYRAMTAIRGESVVRGPTSTDRILYGVTATERVEERFTVTLETAMSAEVPTFLTRPTQAAALAAKARVRARRAGAVLTDSARAP